MTHEIILQPVSVMTDGGSQEGRLAFVGEDLIAVLVRVTASETAGGERHTEGWFLEAGFGPCSSLMTVAPPVFATLDEALQWIRGKLGARLASP
jgi:hypothetical protein